MKAKRILALLLALVMALTLLPTAAGATEETEETTFPTITVTRELPEEPETPESNEITAPLSKDDNPVDPDAERNVVFIDDGSDDVIPGLPGDEGVYGELEIVSEREPDEAPEPSPAPKRRGGVRNTYTFSGSGTETDPWKISSVDDLLALAETVNAGNACDAQYFALTQDLTLTAGSWTPIGCAWDITFAGVFDGNDHIISGVVIESEDDYVGLFGCVTGTVKNLNVSGGKISGRNYVGGIAGCSYGVIDGCDFSGEITGGDYVGGIAGCSGKDATVKDCDVNAEVNASGTGIGGVVGWANNIAGASNHNDALNDPDSNATGGGIVSGCTYTGELTGRSPSGLGVATSENGTITITVTANAFGGIVGWSNGCTVSECENYGTVNGDDFAGGVVGDSSNGGRVEFCGNYGEVHGASMLNGGIAGRISEGSIFRCGNHGAVTGGDFTGGVVGAIDKYSSISDCANLLEGSASSESGQYVGGVVGIANCAVTTCYNEGSVTGAYGVGGVVGWTTREIRDCYHQINAAVVATSDRGRVGGVVGCTYGLVENCFNKGSVDGVSSVEGEVKAPALGGICGHLYGTMKNCQNYNTATVRGGISVGGCVGGATSSALVSGCANYGAVSGISQVGGVVGITYCLVSDSANLEGGTVTGSNVRTGGVIGSLEEKGSCEHVRNEGTVTGAKYVGGLIGLSRREVSGLTNSGSVNGNEYVGGIAGYCDVVSSCSNSGAVGSLTSDKVGGIVGAGNGSIASCTNTGTVEGKVSAGGIVGAAVAVVTNCRNSGSVSVAGDYAGGVIGYCGEGSEINACSNAAAVSGANHVGGITGYTYGEGGGISDCRNTAEAAVTGSTNEVGGIVGSTNAPVSNCENSAAVSGYANVGGIAGLASHNATIEHCTNTSGAVVTGTNDEVGGILGVGTGALDNCVNEGTVTGTDNIGGIVGSLFEEGAVRNCWNKGTVSGADCIGGLAGKVGQTADGTDPSGLVEAGKNTGSVSGGASVGGAVGVLHGTLRDCENSGAVVGSKDGVGGVVGYNKQGGTVDNCKNLKALTAGTNTTGGVVGANAGTIEDCVNYAVVSGGDFSNIGGIAGSSNGTISGCTNKAKVTSNSETTGGIAGSNGGTITGCSNAGQITNASGHAGGIAGQGNGSIANCANTGKVSSKTSGNVYAGGIAGRCSGSITNCTNSAEITAGNGVGGIVGIISGGGSVTGCGNSGRINAPAGAAGGIVGALYSNCKAVDCTNSGYINASGQDSVGGIIGIAYNNNTVTNCTNTGNVTGYNNVGGILGENGSSGTYSKLTNSGTVSGNYETGGIAGDATAAFYDCLNTGSVTGSGGNDTHGTGGICGRLSGSGAKAERCKNEGTISGTYFVGGIVGLDNDASLYSSLNTGAVNSRNTSAGIARVGGVVGYIQNATVSKCVNYASVGSGTNINHVGGIAGSAAKTLFDFCRNYATITGRQEVGGIVGYVTHINNSGTTIQRCINTGHVTASGGSIADVGGIVGKADYYTTVNECANNNPNAKVQADTGKYGGGIAGLINEGTISNSYNTGYVFAHGARGGIVGEMKYHCTMATCFNYAGGDQIPVSGVAYDRGALAGQYDPDATTWTNNYYSYYLGLPPTGKQGAATADSSGEYMYLGAWGRGAFNEQGSFSGFNFSTVYQMQSDRPKLRMEGGVATYNNTGPTGTADPIPTQLDIYTVQDLENLRNNVNAGTDYSRTTIRLCSDLDMSGVGWTPIGTDTVYFNGTFDGQGHTIYNLSVTNDGLLVGLFGSVSGTIRNLEVHGTVTATNASQAYAGGLVGFVYGGTVESCAFYGDVTYTGSGTCYAGGLVSLMNPSGTVQNCYHVGAVSGSGTTVSAGLVAYLAAGTLTNCYHYTGQISGTYSAGVAAINGGTVQNCFVLEGTATDLVTMGSSTNVAFKPAADFPDTKLINAGLGASWFVGDPSPAIPALSYQTILYANDGTASGRICGVKRFRGTLPACPFTRDGYTFLGWNTAEDGSGTWYEDCGSVGTPPEGLFVLYAQWLQGTPYYGYSSSNAGTLLDNNNSSTFNCPDLERGATATITFRTNDAVRPCAIAFLTAGADCETPPGWRLEGKIHESDGDWTLLAASDGASLSRAGRTVYAKLNNVGEDYYSFYRIVWQGPSATLKLADAHLMVADAGADVRRPLTLHSNDTADQTNVVNADNGATATLGNPFASENKYFLNWNTAADGSGASYANYASYTVDGVTDLYAQWLEGTHYRSYTALKVYDQFTEQVNGVPQNDAQYLGYNTQEYGCLVDDNNYSKWCVKVRADAYWSLEFSTDDYVKPLGYVLVTADDTASNPGRNPKNWTLEGLSADGTWIMLDGILDDQSLPAANYAEICRRIGNDQEYCTYRITFRGLGSGKTFQLSELYLITDGSARKPVLTFDSHGGNGTTASISAKAQATVQLPESGFTREGYDFTGWNTAKDGSGTAYAPGADFLVSGDATFYAQWTPKSYAVRFLGENGETLYETAAVSGQLPVYKGEAPAKEGDAAARYVFVGWTPVIVPVDRDATYAVRFEQLMNTYEDPVWSWGGNHSSATASFTCITDPGRVETVQTTEVSVNTTPATCTENGKTEYVATVTFLGKEYRGVDTVPIEMLGHAYELTGWSWSEYSAAKATFTCKNDASHVQNVDATITSKRTEPTCEGAGKIVYTAKVTFEGKEYKDTKTEILQPTGHDYELTGWTWAINAEVNAIFTCKNDPTHVHALVAAVTSETTLPTCDGEGKIVYTAKVTFEGKEYKDTKTEILRPTGHAYALTDWTWKDDLTAAKAIFTCGNDASHVQEIAAAITSERTEPTCLKAGKIVYTAKVVFEDKEYTDVKTEMIEPTGHSYGAPTWNWSADCKTAEAVFACVSGDDEQKVRATVVSLTVEPTCTLPGKITYTATVTFAGKNYSDRKEVTIQPLGHSYGAPVWSWADDHGSAKATFTCAKDANHVQEVNAKVTSVRTEPTCEDAGKIVYTAKVIFEGNTYEDVKTVTIDPTGHAYALTGWTWTGYTAATATFTCGNDASHVENVTATITSVRTEPTADDDGKIVYTAKVTFEGKTYQDEKTEILPALGRDYELTGWNWTGYTAAEASFTDKNGSGDITVEAKITSARTEPTCETAGKIVYTATVTVGEKTYTDAKTEVLEPTGHAYALTGWTWTGYTAAKATFTCGNDTSHVQEVNATVTSVRSEPTCEGAGKIVYTAKVTFEDKEYTDEKTETLDPTGHDYALTGWTWTGYAAAKATFTCCNDASHVQEIEATVTSERTAPTCEGAGKIVYTAKLTFEDKDYKDTKTETLDPIGHAYTLTGWEWKGYTAAKAIFTCGNDASHVTGVEATITSERTEPTADEDGKIVYTATVAFEGRTYKDEKTEILPALGREYELTGWTWDGYTAATASFTDKNGSGTITIEASITSERTEPTCEEDGKVVYIASVTVTEKTFSDEKTEILPATGHRWGEPVYVWAEDDASVTATVTCLNDASHKITETAATNFVLTQYSTYKTEGRGVYTATFTNGLFTTQTKEITIPAVACDGGDACPGKHFTDEPPVEHWAHIPIDWAVVNKITFGTTPTTFTPDAPCTRAQFVTFLWRTMGQPEPTITVNPFKDVTENAYYYKAVLWAYENKITDGTSATTFSPDLNCTRAQIVTFLWRMEGCQEPASAQTAFTDIQSGAYYFTAVLWAVEKGVTDGTSATTFSPDDFCTRAQCLAFLYREFAK